MPAVSVGSDAARHGQRPAVLDELAEARAHVDELRHLLEVGRTISSSLELDDVLAQTSASLAQMIHASTVFTLLLDDPTQTLRIVACSSPTLLDRARRERIALDEQQSIAAESVRTGRPVVVRDARASSRVSPHRVELFSERALLAVPLIARDRAIGVIIIDDVSGPREWSRGEVEGATAIAQQVAVAVVNARLYEDLRRSYAEVARTQKELVRSERLAALGELAAVVAHEVRNPLAVIINAVGTLRRLLRPAGETALLLSMVGEELERIGRIVSDMLDFARPSAPHMQDESLGEIVEAAVEAVEAAKAAEAVRLCVAVPADLPRVRVDRRLMHQALVNLLLNGVQATPRGGQVDVTASRAATSRGPTLRVAVRDQGSGIDETARARLFEPFFTTKSSGTGLGLAVVKRIAEAHGGSVHVDGGPGEGATFMLDLPLAGDR